MRSSHRPRFSEWQHPDVKAFLKAEASRERAVATQARVLLAGSTLAPLFTRIASAIVGVGATLATAIDAICTAGALFAVYRLVLLSLAGGSRGADAATNSGRAAAVSETDLSPAQRRLIGERRVVRSPRDVDAHVDAHDAHDAVGSHERVRRRFGATSRSSGFREKTMNDGSLFVGVGTFV
jgi:hypothetical protein